MACREFDNERQLWLERFEGKEMEMEVYGVGSRELHIVHIHYNC